MNFKFRLIRIFAVVCCIALTRALWAGSVTLDGEDVDISNPSPHGYLQLNKLSGSEPQVLQAGKNRKSLKVAAQFDAYRELNVSKDKHYILKIQNLDYKTSATSPRRAQLDFYRDGQKLFTRSWDGEVIGRVHQRADHSVLVYSPPLVRPGHLRLLSSSGATLVDDSGEYSRPFDLNHDESKVFLAVVKRQSGIHFALRSIDLSNGTTNDVETDAPPNEISMGAHTCVVAAQELLWLDGKDNVQWKLELPKPLYVNTVCASPDGTRISAVDVSGSLVSVDTATGQLRWRLEELPKSPWQTVPGDYTFRDVTFTAAGFLKSGLVADPGNAADKGHVVTAYLNDDGSVAVFQRGTVIRQSVVVLPY